MVVVRFPFMMRVEVETDLKLPIPPPMLSIPSRPPKVVEKEENSTVESNNQREERKAILVFNVSKPSPDINSFKHFF